MDSLPLTERDVKTLYRSILGRDPESADTIAAFRAYYPDLAAGRRAILTSEEFGRVLGGLRGATAAADGAASRLALALLRRAGGTADVAGPQPAGALATALATICGELPAARLAVIWGDAAAHPGLAPLGPGGCILHLASVFPAHVPQIGTAPCGAMLFRLENDAPALLRLLAAAGLACDVLVQLETGAPDLPLAPRAVVALGPGCDALAEPAAMEPLPPIDGFRIFHRGGWHLPVSYTAPPEPPARCNAEEFPALAIAAIVRNEAEALPHMLRSALPVASFVLVADTGSTDTTIAAGRAVLEKAGTPHRIVPIEAARFDAMRNAALDLVPEWVEWVLMLDADEALAAEDFPALLTLLRDTEADAFALPRYNYLLPQMGGSVAPYPDRQIRLLRNHRDRLVRYSGAVHETVRGVRTKAPMLDAAVLGLGRGGPHIHHLVRRFRTPEQEARKQEYYRELATIAASAAIS